MRRVILTLATVVALFLPGASALGQSDGTTQTFTAAKQFVIHLRAVSLGPRRIRIQGTTNLPNRSRIFVSASRVFRNKGEKDVRAIHAGGWRNVIVSKGRFGALMNLDEKTLLLGVGTSKYDDRIAEIDDAITACADFQTGKDNDGKLTCSPPVLTVQAACFCSSC